MSLLGGIDGVSWDVDGTLYELPGLMRALRRLALRRGLTAPVATARDLLGLARRRRAFDATRAAGGVLASPVAADARLDALLLDAVRAAGPRPGVVEALARLRARGLRLLATSDHPAADKLEALGLAGAFEGLVVGEALGALKPSPRLLLAAAERLGMAPARLLHVGDRADADGAAAAAAGCRVLLLGPGPVPEALR